MDAVDVTERNAEVFGLGAGVATEKVRVAEDPAEFLSIELLRLAALVGTVAHRELLGFAVLEGATGDREGSNHAVTSLELGNLSTNVFNSTDTFVAEDLGFLEVRNVGGVGDCGLVDGRDADIALALVGQGMYGGLAGLVAICRGGRELLRRRHDVQKCLGISCDGIGSGFDRESRQRLAKGWEESRFLWLDATLYIYIYSVLVLN